MLEENEQSTTEKALTVENMPIGEVTPYAKNPRINDDAVEAVAKSIKEFGFRNPIIVDPDKVVIAGHTRLKAAKELGLSTVPVIVADGLTPKQVKALRIADNKTAELAEWDMSKLVPELKELKDDDFDMDALGFTEFEIASMLNPAVEGGGSLDDYEEPSGDAKEEKVFICPECGHSGRESEFKA